MYRIAVLGEYDSIYGFATLGLETFPVSDAEQGSTQLRRLAESGYAVIYVTESMAEQIKKEIERYKTQMLPAIILIFDPLIEKTKHKPLIKNTNRLSGFIIRHYKI